MKLGTGYKFILVAFPFRYTMIMIPSIITEASIIRTRLSCAS